MNELELFYQKQSQIPTYVQMYLPIQQKSSSISLFKTCFQSNKQKLNLPENSSKTFKNNKKIKLQAVRKNTLQIRSVKNSETHPFWLIIGKGKNIGTEKD